MIIVCLRYSSGNVRLPDRRLYTRRPHADFGRDDHREDAPHFNVYDSFSIVIFAIYYEYIYKIYMYQIYVLLYVEAPKD